VSRVVLVHGAFNELWGPHQIAEHWVPPLRDGLWHAGVDLDPAEVGVAFYGDLFRLDPDAGEVPDPSELAQRSGLLDVIARVPGADQLEAVVHAVGDAAHDRLADQIGRFLAAGDVRQTVRARVDEILGPDTDLVVAHSLGTIVAYQVLAGRPELTPALITIGSPLATPLAFDRLRPAPVDGVGVWPGGVRSWTNVAAVGDPACGGRGFGGRFGERVVEHLVDNGHRAHDPQPYLNAPVTGRAVAAALGLVGS
jgi:pimeloyl-ACP methyl ester carboxylesterase